MQAAGPDRGSGSSAAEDRDASLGAGARGLMLLAAEGFSVGLAIGSMTLGPVSMARFVGGNALPPAAREALLQVALAGALVGLLLGALAWRERTAIGVLGAGRRLAPALLSAVVPALLDVQAWQGRELHFLVLAGSFVVGIPGLGRTAQLAPPLRAWPGAGRRIGSALRRALLATRRLREPLFVVCMAALAYALYFGYYTIGNHRNGFTASFDLGLEDNALWNIVHGGPFLKSSPFSGPTGSLVGYHAIFFAYALAPLYAVHQSPETLLAIQALLAGGAAIPLFLWSRHQLGPGPAATLSLCYLLYPPVHGANLYDFHYLVLAPFFIWSTLWALERRRDALAAAGVVLCLALREDVAASVAVLGLYFLLSNRRPKAGLLVSGAALVYFLLVKFLLMPMAQPDPAFLYAWADLLPAGERSFSGVLKTVIGNPAYTLGTVLTLPKLAYFLQVLVPVAFLPLRRPLGWLFLTPGLLFTLLSTGYAPFVQISFQYTAHWTSFVFPAAALALCSKRRSASGEEQAPEAFRAAVAALVAGTIICTHQYGAVLQRQTAKGGFERFRFTTTDVDRARRRELAELVARVPDRAKLAASENVVPHVSGRPDAYTLRLGIFDAEYLLFARVPTAAGELEREREALSSGSFGVVAAGSHYVLARRGVDTSGNPAVLEYLSHLVPTGAAKAVPDPR